jgi:hypothetical protein
MFELKHSGKLVRASLSGAAIVALVGLCVREFPKFITAPNEIVLAVVEATDSDGIAIQPESINANVGNGAEGTILPSARQRWVFYASSGTRKTRIWAVDHLEFDFMKDGTQPFRVLKTYLEPGTFIVVYKEHGATKVTVVVQRKPIGESSPWTHANTQTVAEDSDANFGSVSAADLVGHVNDNDMALRLTRHRPGGGARIEVFALRLAGWWWDDRGGMIPPIRTKQFNGRVARTESPLQIRTSTNMPITGLRFTTQ